MPDIDIRPAEASDVALILRFIKELAIYERAEHEVVATETDIENSLLDEGSPARAVICSVDGVHAGLAVQHRRPTVRRGSVQQGLSAAGGVLGFYWLSLAAD